MRIKQHHPIYIFTSGIQRPEISTTTAGVLSDHAMKDAPKLRDRLGTKGEVASSTDAFTDDISPPPLVRIKSHFFSENSKWGAPPNSQQLVTLLLLVVTLTASVTFCNTSSTEKKQIQRTIN